MSNYQSCMTPEDIPDYEAESEEHQLARDTAVTDWLGGRQPTLEPIEALLGEEIDDAR